LRCPPRLHRDIHDEPAHQFLALLGNENQELQNRGVVNPSHALDSVDGASLHQEFENLLGFVERSVHALQGLLSGFLERLAALATLIPLIALAVLPFAFTFDPAIVARHGWNLLEIHSRKRDTEVGTSVQLRLCGFQPGGCFRIP
jgi:hypothetical protein